MTQPPESSVPPFRAELLTIIEERVSLAPIDPLGREKRPLLTVIRGPQRGLFFRLSGTSLTLGRSDEADAVLADPGLSRVHARISQTPEGDYIVEDCGSTNGTFIGDTRISAAVKLVDGAQIGLGRRTVLKFSMQDSLEEQALLDVYESAMRDRLTGAFNRGVFDERLTSEFAFAKRHKKNMAILLFDVDHFKKVNDTYGHPVGDAVLIAIADAVQRTLRTEDVFARYGGEEFVVIARESAEPNARVLAERIRRAVSALRIPVEGQELKVAASVGVACMGPGRHFEKQQDLLEAADQALYAAKNAGRNRVVIFGEHPELAR